MTNHTHHIPNRTPCRPARAGRGFTLVELLVVIVIISLLLTLLVVGLSRAVDRAGSASTLSQLQALSQGIQAFNNEFQYDPPLVTGIQRSGINGIVTPELRTDNAQVLAEYATARFHSEFSLPIYLLGMGDTNADGTLVYGDQPNLDDGQDDPGLRNPGEFRAWKRRDSGGNLEHLPPASGRVYGPYIDPGTMRDAIEQVRVDSNLRPVETGGFVLYRFTDRWGHPIRYYRNWPTKNRNPVNGSGNSDTSVAFTPVEIRDPEALRDQIERGLAGDSRQVLEQDRTVLSSRYMLLSAGAKSDEVDQTGQFIVPFGDVVLRRSDEARQAIGIDTPFDPNALDARARELLRKFTLSNLRVAG